MKNQNIEKKENEKDSSGFAIMLLVIIALGIIALALKAIGVF